MSFNECSLKGDSGRSERCPDVHELLQGGK